MEILMHLRSLKKTKKDVSLHDPIGMDKEGNELPLRCYPSKWLLLWQFWIQSNFKLIILLILLFSINSLF
ncbi:hypothetical protein EEL32_24355 [Brevibacillus laterosporus]|nr:hypothetical protein EEL31_00405 [Brevibacillus laterosporus]TPG75488.1 hypothetical protein EEL32_24355 [Brevibacillus laterosporus]